MNRSIVIVALLMLILAIILGAFGAHGLKELVTAERLQTFEVGVKYQFYQGLGLLIIGLNAEKFRFPLKPVWLLLLIGTILFSVSIYFLSIQDVLGMSLKFLGPITPIGGLLMIIGWMILLWKTLKQKD
jgi:uncharacterized membrane protein YgdD (TMEM256/DUF423 family)